MKTAKLATSALTALTLVAAAGCGGDGDEPGGGGALTKGEYQKQGNALCRDAVSELEELDPPNSPDEIPDFAERLFDLSYGYNDEFEALEPPAELREDHEEILRLSEGAEEEGDEIVARLRKAENPQKAFLRELREMVESPEFKRNVDRLRGLGLDDCVDVGVPADSEAS